MTLQEALARYPGAETFSFGGGPVLSAEILGLVRAGKKTVTCGALEAFAARGDALPKVGRIDIALDPMDEPACAIRTTEVQHMPFDGIPDTVVAAQGEFRTLTDWRGGFREQLTRAGHFHPQVMMVVEWFELVEDFGESPDV